MRYVRSSPCTGRVNVEVRPRARRTLRYNEFTNLDEVSVICTSGADNDDHDSGVAAKLPRRSVVVRTNGGSIRTIAETHRAFDALHFVLLMPHGDDGWTPGMKRVQAPQMRPIYDVKGTLYGVYDPQTGCWLNDDRQPLPGTVASADSESKKNQLSPLQYYGYRIHPRAINRSTEPLFKAGRLFQEYVCVSAAKVASERLSYLSTHQEDIRADLYQNIKDAAAEKVSCGKRIVLPGTFTGACMPRCDRCFQAGM